MAEAGDYFRGGSSQPSAVSLNMGEADPPGSTWLATPPWTGGGGHPEFFGSLPRTGGATGGYRGRGALSRGGEVHAPSELKPGTLAARDPPGPRLAGAVERHTNAILKLQLTGLWSPKLTLWLMTSTPEISVNNA